MTSATTTPPDPTSMPSPPGSRLEFEGAPTPTGSRQPEKTEAQLLSAEANHLADAAELKQAADAFAKLFIGNDRKIISGLGLDGNFGVDEKKREHFQTLKQELQYFYTEDGKPILIKGFEPTAEQTTLAAIFELILKRQISGELVQKLVAGGINFVPKNPHPKTVDSIDEVAHFFPQRGNAGSRIDLYESAFADNMDTKKIIYHELAHALLLHDGVISTYSTENADGLAPHLSDEEAAVIKKISSNWQSQRPWETPYVAQLLDQFGKDPGNQKVLYHVLEEMRAERLRLFLESDGSLGDFIKKRLENSTLSRSQTGSVPGQTGTEFAAISKNLAAILGELSDTTGTSPAYLEMLNQFADNTDQDINAQGALKAFLGESFQLHARFSRLVGEDNHKALLGLIDSRPVNLATYPFGDVWDQPEYSLMGQNYAPQQGKGRNFLQWLMDMFASIAEAFRG